MTIFGDKAFKKVLKIKCGHKDPNPMTDDTATRGRDPRDSHKGLVRTQREGLYL